MNKKIILASASPRRKELLTQVGINPIIQPSNVEEVVTSNVPQEVVVELSKQKAADVASGYRGQAVVVIGADTVVASNGQILGKPVDEDDAISMLQGFQGKSHEVYTGVTIIFCETGKEISFAEETKVMVYPMTLEQITAYVKTGDPLDKAGAYGIQGQFAAFVQGIEGDYNNVVGLPVGRVYQTLLTQE